MEEPPRGMPDEGLGDTNFPLDWYGRLAALRGRLQLNWRRRPVQAAAGTLLAVAFLLLVSGGWRVWLGGGIYVLLYVLSILALPPRR